MRNKFLLSLLYGIMLPAILIAQTRQKQVTIKPSADKYPGGAYAVWDPVSKQYKWYSPQKGYLNNSKKSLSSKLPCEEISKTSSEIFHLVKDINDAKDGGGGNYQPQVYNQHYAVLNGVAYFSSYDGIHGDELWRSDETRVGTYLLKDIEPGIGSSGISNITAANGKIYFTAVTSANGPQPWISDGTETGTHMIKEVLSSLSNGGFPEMYTAADNKVFFLTGRNQLWVTEGTDAGTQQVAIALDYSSFLQLTAVGDQVFYVYDNYFYGKQLWRSDGTAAGTYMVLFSGYNNAPQQLTAYNGKLYFTSDNGLGRRLWVSDGTTEGTVEVQNNNVAFPFYDGVGNSIPDVPLVISNGALYFIAFDIYGNTGTELYKYNPDNSDGVVLVKDITPGFEDTGIEPFEMVGSDKGVAFKVSNADGTASLWKTQGNESNTKEIRSFETVNGYNFYNLLLAGDLLFFETYTASNGFELWKSNGTPAGTVTVKDIFPGIYSSYPYFYTNTPNGVLFSARTLEAGYELWKTDGTSGGTQLLKDINQTSSGSSIFPYNITNTENGVVFSAFDVLHGVEPFYSDGTEANTQVIADIYYGDFSSFPYAMKTVNGIVYFLVNYDDKYKQALHKYNPAQQGVTKLFEAPQGYTIQNIFAVADNGLVFFQMYNANYYQYGIWRTDGTDSGSFFLLSGYVSELVTIGNTAFFPYDDTTYARELYKSDGTIKGTGIVKDIYAGGAGSSPYDLFAYNGQFIFGATEKENNTTAFWKSDGTFRGTKKVADIAPVYNYDLSNTYCISNGLLFINAFSYVDGESLWKTDGTTSGTKFVKAINPYLTHYINHLTDVNGIVCFTADDGINGNELWESNGTENGTRLLKDITAGSGGSNIYNLCSAGGKLYFMNDGSLWQSTGFGNKTKPVKDQGLQGVSNITELTASGNKIFFAGYTDMYGEELYEGDVAAQAVASADAVGKQSDNTLKAILSPNPVHYDAKLQLLNADQADIIISDNSGKITWREHTNSSLIQIPSQQFAPGIYYIKLTSGGQTAILKLIKE